MVVRLRFLLESHPDVHEIVRGRKVVFGRFSGFSLDGDIVLYSGEVRHNWLNVMKRAPEAEKLLKVSLSRIALINSLISTSSLSLGK